MDVVNILGWFVCICEVVCASNGSRQIFDREYNMVGGAEVIKLQQLIFEFGAIA